MSVSFAWVGVDMQDVLQQVGKAIKITNGADTIQGELSSWDDEYLYIMSSESAITQYERSYWMGVTFTASVATPLEDVL